MCTEAVHQVDGVVRAGVVYVAELRFLLVPFVKESCRQHVISEYACGSCVEHDVQCGLLITDVRFSELLAADVFEVNAC